MINAVNMKNYNVFIITWLSFVCISSSQIASPEPSTIPTTQNVTTTKKATTQPLILPITTQQPNPITNFNKEVLH